MSEQKTKHAAELARLKRIEGQIRGVQNMIQEERYCVDIMTQIASIVGAIKSMEESILERHLKGCVKESFAKGSQEDKERKIAEVIDVLRKFRKY